MAIQLLTDSRLANLAAKAIWEAFDSYQAEFARLTQQAQHRFETRDWRGMQSDSAERLEVYRHTVDHAVSTIHSLLNDRGRERFLWAGMKAVFSALISDRGDRELAETFFNSVTRRIFTTVGVDPQVEFVDSDFENPHLPAREGIFTRYDSIQSALGLAKQCLVNSPFEGHFENIARDAELVAQEMETHGFPSSVPVEMLKSVFYRDNGAYLIGRGGAEGNSSPLVLCLLNTPRGVVVDAVLLNEDEVSILFSFTRSYFHVQTDLIYELIAFLRSMMPQKPISELYTSIGRNKHGKTELYRDLLRHLSSTNSTFEIAPGTPGMVMCVFSLPSFGVVFKVIKDSFDYPKKTSRKDVMGKYGLVFAHDRAGRLVDAQEFEHLRFERKRFSPYLLELLLRTAGDVIAADEEFVVISHLYTERKLIPLDLYLRNAPSEEADAAVVDYGNALKDLARANIFPGDVLLKNFGVTRHGRVTFYDYDELCLLTDCNFRSLPDSQDEMQMFTEDEPWFYVGENDYFPQEFLRFLGLPQRCRDVFLQHHSDLLDPTFWCGIQDRLRAGEVIHIFPYPQLKRLRAQ